MSVPSVLCIILLFAAANAEQQPGQNPWLDSILPPAERVIEARFFETSHTYTFLYDAQLASGIPGTSKQHSGTRIQCLAELIFSSQTSCTLQLSHIRVGRLNSKLDNPRQLVPFEAFEEVPLHEDVKRTLEIPVGFTYHDGVVGDVTFDGEESPWTTNVIRGVLNMLQLTLKSEGEISAEDEKFINVKTSEDISGSEAKHYRIQEKTLEGDCESVYTMFNISSEEDADRLVIIKSIDFDKCSMRPEIKYNIRFAHPCPDCRAVGREGKHEFLKPSTVARYVVRVGRTGSWLVEKANFESEHIFSPYDPQAGVALSYINQTLLLLKTEASTNSARPINHPVKSEWGLLYALDWDIWKERFFMDGEEDRQLHFLRRMPYSDVKRQKRTLVSALIRAVLEHTSIRKGIVDEEAPPLLLRIVNAFRMFTKLELDELYGELASPDEGPWTDAQRKVITDLMPHIIAMCSTKECISFLVDKIQDGTIGPQKAGAAIKNLLNDRSISEKEIAKLLELADSQIVAQNFYFRQSYWLTLGSLMNGLCMGNDEVLARSYKEDVTTFCIRQQKENYVEILLNKFNSAEKWADKVLFMKAIGNAGIDLSIFKLEKIIRNTEEGQHYSDSVRSEAILALRQLTSIMPRKIQKILMPLVTNQFEKARVRISAAYQLLQTMPERAILDQLARMVVCDSSRQVVSFIYSYMKTLAQSSSPCRQKMATDLKLALQLAEDPGRRAHTPGYSSMRHKDIYSEQYIAGLEMELGSVFLNTSFLPKYMSATFHANAMGFWQKYLFTFGLVQDGLDEVVRDWMVGRADRKQGKQENTAKRFRRLVAAAVEGLQNEMNALFTKLGVKPRRQLDKQKEPKAYAYMKVMDQDYVMLPFIFTGQKREKQAAEGVINVKSLIEDLRRGITLNTNEADLLAEMSYKVPTILGMPLVWNLKVPVMYSIAGRIQATTTGPPGTWDSMKIMVDLKPSFVATIIMEMEAWSPIVNSGLKVLSTVKSNTPIDATLEINRRSDPAVTKLTYKLPPGKRDLLSLETRPVTLTRVWPQRPLKTWNEPDVVTMLNHDQSRVSKFKQCFGKQILGANICVRGQYFRTTGVKSETPQCPLSGVQKILITSEAQEGQSTTEVSVKISTKFNERLSEPISPEFSDWSNFPIEDESSESTEEPNSPHRQYQVRYPMQHSMKIEVESNKRPLMNADFVHQYDPNHLYGKVDWKVQLLSNPKLAVCWKSETLFPTPPFTVNDMQDMEKKKVMSANKITWGSPQCQDTNALLVQMEAHQSQSYGDYHSKNTEHETLEQCMEGENTAKCSPVVQYEHILKNSDLTKYRFIIENKNVPSIFINATVKMYERLKHALYEKSDVDSMTANNPKKKVYARLELNPMDKSQGDLLIRTPNENAAFKDVRVPKILPVINLKRGHMKTLTEFAFGNGNRAVCHISNKKVKTFDGVEFSAPISTCYHVLAKDCASAQPRFVVMMRKLSNGENKELRVVTATHKVSMVSKDNNTIGIDINGQEYMASSDQVQELTGPNGVVLVKIFAMGPYVKLEFPLTKLFVYFDGYAANVKLSHIYLRDQCGLCGHFDNEQGDEFRKPDFTLENDVRKFYMAWVLKGQPSGCSVPDITAISRTFGAAAPGKEATVKAVKQTKVVEMNNEICFSVEPVDVCPIGSYPAEKETRQIQFVCLEKEDEMAEAAFDTLRTEDTVQINRDPSGMRNLDVPTKCMQIRD